MSTFALPFPELQAAPLGVPMSASDLTTTAEHERSAW